MAHLADTMLTSNPSCDYQFSWTIENFHLMYLTPIRGPIFAPILGCLKKFCMELVFEYDARTDKGYLDFNMIGMNAFAEDRFLQVCGKIVIKCGKVQVSDFVTFPLQNVQPNTTKLHSFSRNSFGRLSIGTNLELAPRNFKTFGLAHGKIILEGTLTFSGYSIRSGIDSITVTYCEEVKQDLKFLEECFESGLSSDIVTFKVGGQVLRAHKAILIGQSEVFAKMFQHEMLENETNNVPIEDTDYCTFKSFLVYLYTGGVINPLKGDCPTATKYLYSVAHKYQVKNLCKICVARLVKELSVDSVCTALLLADLHNDDEFKGIVKNYVRENFTGVVGTLAWADMVVSNHDLVQEVLEFVQPANKNP